MSSASSHDARCEDAVERLYHFLDGELDEERKAVIQRHLDECLPCLEVFDFELVLRQLIARRCTERVPEQLRSRITLAIRAEFGAVQDPGGMEHL